LHSAFPSIHPSVYQYEHLSAITKPRILKKSRFITEIMHQETEFKAVVPWQKRDWKKGKKQQLSRAEGARTRPKTGTAAGWASITPT
jgi:hypothetical protein